ncbi:MAG: hypothetical protein A2785_03000 [Candidatus Chisholmbacteria bacterium RIFCSPHIGHO2_01_FULL_49_18]|uniref:Uncharacterized protein n=2 Tax=Candidatus Chisholmiibacteriota TaxID=1817900 RepID=A0A1G1VMB7_9BACT|nr:MAG: hypothetical protein A2785_03000 [Candidatus Chisholmbacteria bacterium RIFCSPHIGHO2_01_FULL_49_18]OGY21005.1 MAG: hypothetical protein A3A65_01700 [Candidatus Chisholmbacteria bacterium RIFCSPLOWO2_01_FULL_49_14]
MSPRETEAPFAVQRLSDEELGRETHRLMGAYIDTLRDLRTQLGRQPYIPPYHEFPSGIVFDPLRYEHEGGYFRYHITLRPEGGDRWSLDILRFLAHPGTGRPVGREGFLSDHVTLMDDSGEEPSRWHRVGYERVVSDEYGNSFSSEDDPTAVKQTEEFLEDLRNSAEAEFSPFGLRVRAEFAIDQIKRALRDFPQLTTEFDRAFADYRGAHLFESHEDVAPLIADVQFDKGSFRYQVRRKLSLDDTEEITISKFPSLRFVQQQELEGITLRKIDYLSQGYILEYLGYIEHRSAFSEAGEMKSSRGNAVATAEIARFITELQDLLRNSA